MNIIIRADSSIDIGSGHMMRCITLAERLKNLGIKVSFICRILPGNISAMARTKGFEVFELYANVADDWLADANCTTELLKKAYKSVDWLIVDHYGLDIRWERELRPFTKNIMVIDDLANRAHDCDLLLDTNFYCQSKSRYRGLVSSQTNLLLGPTYVLLRSEFNDSVDRQRDYLKGLKRILIFFGGSDPTNETGKLLKTFPFLACQDIEYDVIVGSANPNKEDIQQQCSLYKNVHFYCQISNMAEMMAKADLAIGAGGTATWERCYVGLPSIVIAVADNQVETSQALAGLGAIHYLGFYQSVNVRIIYDAVTAFAAQPEKLLSMSRIAKKVVPQNGTKLVSRHLLSQGTIQSASKTKDFDGNVLVSSASKKIPLLQAVKQALSVFGGRGKIVAGDSDANCLARYFAEDFWRMPTLAKLTDELLLAELHQRGIRYIIPTRDGELPFWSGKRESLRRSGIAVMVSDLDIVNCCLDKLCFYRKCQELDIPSIETATCLENFKENRVVVKERYGAGSQRIGINLTWEQAAEYAIAMENPIFQPYVEGREYSIDAYVDCRGQVKGLICRSRDRVVNGESQITTTVNDTQLERLCSEYITKLGMYGHAMLQVIVDVHDKLWIIECNPRFGGASTLSIAAGLDSFYWFLLEAQGQSLADYPFCKTEKRLRQVRYPQDIVQEVVE